MCYPLSLLDYLELTLLAHPVLLGLSVATEKSPLMAIWGPH